MFYRFILVNSADMSPIGELKQARNRQVQVVHKRAGGASFSYPIEYENKEPVEYAERIQPWKTGIKAMRYNWRDSAVSKESGGPNVWDNVWSGYVLPNMREISDNRMQISCVGWLNRLEKRFLHDTKTYDFVADTSTDDSDILLDLLDEMNEPVSADAYVWTPMTGSSTLTLLEPGSKLPNEGVGGATAYEPAYRGMQYDRDQQILQAYIDLMDIENGVDVVVDPDTREVNFYRQYMRDLPNIKFGYEKSPFNVQAISSPLESEKTVNYFLARGSSLSIPRYQDDVVSMAEFGPIEEIVTLSDVVDDVDEAGSILQYYASEEVFLRAFPPYTFNVTPFPYTPENSVPEPFVDYRVGDQPVLSVKKGLVIDEKDLGIRVFGMSIQVSDETGAEQLQALQLTPS